jgi:Tol biopolymer transport system component
LIVFTSGGVVSVVKPDGTGLTKLTAGSAPNWSPDRRKILFEDGGLYVMNADGTSQAILVKDQNDFQVVAYHWSPDGRRIAFLAERCFSYPSCKGFVRDLWVMEADGSRQLMLRAIVSDASWSPDGRKLAFAGGDQLFTINSDGSGGEVRVSDQVFQIGDEAPAWSPDGALIASGALTASGGYGIYVIHPDGSGLVNLTPDPGAYGENPAWSADGSKIAFYYSPDNPSSQGSVAVVNRDGSGRVILTNTGYRNFHWSPDGTQIAFVRNAELQRSDVWVMNADGTGQINVSNTPDADEDFPDW